MGRFEEINDARNTLWNRGGYYSVEECLMEISETLALIYDKMNEKETAMDKEVSEMSDSIDRQKVLATLDFADNALDEERSVEKYKELLAECIKALPSAENKGDLISRQAVIDALTKTSGIRGDALKALYDLPSVENKGEWISVSERLPNHDEYIKNNGLFNVSDGNRSYSEWFDISDKQRFGEPTMSGFRVDYAVTAWQPLPEPYKAEKGGE